MDGWKRRRRTGAGRPGPGPGRDRGGSAARVESPVGRLALVGVSAVLAYFLLAVGVQVVGHEVRALGAAYGWSGESGRVTVTHEERVRNETYCYGTYESGEDTVREGVRVHSSGECTPGRVADVRSVPGRDTWVTTTAADRVYEDAGFGSGAGVSLVLVVFIGVFCFGLGGLFGLGAVAVGGGLAMEAVRRLLPQSK